MDLIKLKPARRVLIYVFFNSLTRKESPPYKTTLRELYVELKQSQVI